jgi:hypothetical protein
LNDFFFKKIIDVYCCWNAMVIEKDFMVIYYDDMLVLSPTKMVFDGILMGYDWGYWIHWEYNQEYG